MNLQHKIFFILIIVLSSCKQQNCTNIIPYTYIKVRIDTELIDYWKLNNPQGYITLKNEGYNKNGIIVFCSSEGEYKAYDCTCPYQLSEKGKVQVDKNNPIHAQCNKCKTTYELFYGNKIQGKSTCPLKEYNITKSNSILYITN